MTGNDYIIIVICNVGRGNIRQITLLIFFKKVKEYNKIAIFRRLENKFKENIILGRLRKSLIMSSSKHSALSYFKEMRYINIYCYYHYYL